MIGTGYVGLVTGACLAELGHSVVCVDVDEERVAKVRRGEPPIHERGLPELLARHAGQRLQATTDLDAAVQGTDVTLITVGTPFADGRIDLHFVMQAAVDVGRALKSKDAYHVVAVKSTVVPGTTDELVLPILERESGRRAGSDFGVGMNPEFLTEGQAVRDFLDPDRIVLGGVDERTIEVLASLYGALVRTDLDPHQQPDGGDHQVRVERPPRHCDLVRQRDRQLLQRRRRGRRGRRDAGRARERLPQPARQRGPDYRADRLIPVAGFRLRRQLPAEGRERACGPRQAARRPRWT